MRYTTDQLLNSIKIRSMVPVSQQTFTDSDLVTLLNEEMQLSLVPQMLSIRQDYFMDYKRTSLVANKSRYPMPERAIGNALKEVFLVDGGGARRKLVHTDIGVLNEMISTAGQPIYFYISGDEVVPHPTPDGASYQLECWYFKRPNQMVLSENCVQITAVASAGGNTTLTFTANSTFTDQITAGTTRVDVLSNVSPFLLWNEDVVVDTVTSTTVVITETDLQNDAGVTEPQVGDWICLSQQTPIPQFPQELHPILAQMVSARIMEALGHTDKLKVVNEKLGMMMSAAFKMIENRVEHQPKALINRNNILSNAGYTWVGPAFR